MRLTSLIVIFFLSACTASKQPVANLSPLPSMPVEQTWQYREEKDEMTSEPIKFAGVESNNLLLFKFPYDGGSRGVFLLRKTGTKDEILLTITKGQFLSDSTARLKFDDDPPMEMHYSQPADGRSTMIFINDWDKKIIPRLKTAEKLKVEVGFYQEGNKILEFNVKGLQWQQ